jgi:hypothetical protein
MYHKLMNSMSPWTPEEIGKLTPMQVACIACKEPPKPGIDDPDDYVAEMKRREEAWRA